MPSAPLYAGLQDPCNTTLNLSNVAYYMVAFAAGVEDRNSEDGGIRVRAQIYTIGEQGQRSLLADSIVFSAAAGHIVDCVHCVHVADRYLVVYFLDRDTAAGTYLLKARFVDVQTFDTAISWSSMSDISVADAGLYDVKVVDDYAGTSEYMLAWVSAIGAPGTVIVRRVAGNDHTAPVWSTSLSVNVVERVCAVHGDGAAAANNGGVAVAVQNGTNDLQVHVLDYNDGTSVAPTTPVSSTSAEFTCVGLAKLTPPATPTAPTVAVVAEFFETLAPALAGEDDYVRTCAGVEVRITSAPAIIGSIQRWVNVNMLSKPFSYVDAAADRHVYCGLGYITVKFEDPYREQNAFICDLGAQHWSPANTARPRPVANFINQNVDCRPHAATPENTAEVPSAGIGKRMNHLSNFAHGPRWLSEFRKARAVAWQMWAGVQSIATAVTNDAPPRVEPVIASVQTIWYILEDPWTVDRDPEDHGQPSTNYHGCNPGSLYSTTEIQDELLIAGGSPHLYDGQRLTEVGFPWTPEIVDVVNNPAAAGNIPAGDYRYTAVYEWRDSRGQLHRSGHGNIVDYTAPGADSAQLLIRTLTIGNRDAAWLYPGTAPVTIAVYRTTLAQPNIFRRIFATSAAGFTVADIPVNDPSVWAVTVIDDVTNIQLTEAPPLNYIDGGNAEQYTELTPVMPPAAHLVANWQNRAWLVASENKELWYSKENLPTAATGRLAPEFHPSLRFLLDEVDGEVTAVHPADDELILWTRDGIYALSGTGPDALGNGAQYRLTLLYKGVGCIEPRSVVEVPQGHVFQSYTGIHLLDRGRSLNFDEIGAMPEDLIRQAGNIRAAVYLPDRHQVAFVINGAVTDEPLVAKWDFLRKQWSTARLAPPNTTTWLSSTAGGVAWRANERDASLAVLCQGALLVERGKDDATPFRDEDDVGNVEAIRIDVETGWIALAGIAGYKRVREIGVQTELVTGGELLYAELDYDDDGSFSLASPELKQPAQISAYLRLRPRQQKMSAFRLRLYEPSGVGAAENRKIHGIVVHVGVKKGPRKVANTQQE